jgi:hypothetical protein
MVVLGPPIPTGMLVTPAGDELQRSVGAIQKPSETRDAGTTRVREAQHQLATSPQSREDGV